MRMRDIMDQMLTEARAYHGSPHKFRQFSTDHLGTGEGNQVFAWGLYFAAARDVADHYRKKLAVYPSKGKLYTVELPDGPYLLWDEPASRQPVEVLQTLEQHGVSPEVELPWKIEYLEGNGRWMLVANGNMSIWSGFSRKAADEKLATMRAEHDKGMSLYRKLSSALGGDKAASLALLGQGVAGVKYFDAMSRNRQEGTHNYVIFDAKMVKVLGKKDLQAGAVA